MKYDRVIEQAVRKAQIILWANSPALSDAETIRRIRAIVAAPAVQEASERGSDTIPAFALRGVHRILFDRPAPACVTIDRLCDILHELELNRVLGVSSRPGINLWLRKPPAR
jgi:hypothetical protein